jgi:hypothetical protein
VRMTTHLHPVHSLKMKGAKPPLRRDSVAGIATRYRLNDPGIETQSTRDFPHPSRPSLLYHGYWVSFPEVMWSGSGVDHPLPPNAEVKERIELYFYSPLALHGLF